MSHLLIVAAAFILTVSFNQLENGTKSSPSPQGDTHMGADAAQSGTDLDDKDFQKQQDKETNQFDQNSSHNDDEEKRTKGNNMSD